MQRQTILTLLVILLAVGMLVAVADPVAADIDQDADAIAVSFWHLLPPQEVVSLR